MRHSLASFCVALVMVLCVPEKAFAAPDKVVNSYHASLIRIAKVPSDHEARFAALAPVMDAAFDFEGMIKTASSSHWRKSDEHVQKELLTAFRRVSIATYANRFAGLRDSHFEISGMRDGPRGLKLVDTALVTKNENVQISYVMRKKEQGWRIIDVLLDGGISELAVRASEYASILNDGGTAALIKTLNDQSRQLLIQ